MDHWLNRIAASMAGGYDETPVPVASGYQGQLRRFAHDHGLRFSESYPFDPPSDSFWIVQAAGELVNVSWGRWRSRSVRVGESYGDANISFVEVRLGASFQYLLITPKDEGTRIRDLVAPHGHLNIDLESNRFNARYDVRSAHRQFAIEFIDERMMEMLLEVEPNRYSYEVNDFGFIAYCRRLRPGELSTLLDVATRFTDRIPRHLLKRPRDLRR